MINSPSHLSANRHADMSHHFDALLTKVNPPEDRVALASERVGDFRTRLKDHDFETVDPHRVLAE